MYIKELIEKRLDEVQRKEERTKAIMAELDQDLTNRSLELAKVQEEKKQLEEYLKE
ncbi:hypothetical protein [Paenibacillus sp. FSL K6-1318]|uniref:hypothetical protein n=1 Tax=Paenibacillus sp. FSL K6-1318 TaxID=2975291 RepID=UPI0030ED2383